MADQWYAEILFNLILQDFPLILNGLECSHWDEIQVSEICSSYLWVHLPDGSPVTINRSVAEMQGTEWVRDRSED